ncbi:hypothetical protein CRYUN_Cryun13aG0127000 [Craigia yunnanensis]
MPLGDLGTLDVGKNDEAFYTGVKQQLGVADLIARSIAVYETEDKSDPGLTAAVIARSAGVGENYKKVSACNGTTIWEASDKDFVISKNGSCQSLRCCSRVLIRISGYAETVACSPYCICSLTLCFSMIYAHTQEMEPQDYPLKIARFADFGNSWNMESNRLSGEGSPPIGLGLELGHGSGHRPTVFAKSCGFTVFQLQELQLQSLIYKYMEAGLPVPHHLLLPIWKSVASSFGGLHGNPYQLYSGFLGCGSLHLEYKNGLDPEPGRCRRTDGKKWRCSKEAVPNHKYCERHVYRGRQRSRKLVEASHAAAAAAAAATTTTTSSTSSISHTNTDTNLSISLQVDNSSSIGSNLSSSFIGFSPKSVLRRGHPKAEPSLQFQELL